MRSLKILISAILLVGLCACQSVGNLATPAGNAFIAIGVDGAVAAIVGAEPAAHLKAVGISTVAQAALDVDQGDSAELTAINAAIDAQIGKLNLAPADKLAFLTLDQTLGGFVTTALSGGSATTPAGKVTAQAKVAISVVLKDVITAASLY